MAENFKTEITDEVIETFLNGHDPQERIVNIEYSSKDDFVKVFYRNEEDKKCMSMQPFYPFVWARLETCLSLCDGNRKQLKLLMNQYGIEVKSLNIVGKDGNEIPEMKNGYRYLFKATRPMTYHTFQDFFKKCGFPIYSDNDKTQPKVEKPFLTVTPQEQYLIATGKRFFKGYDDYNQILKITFDLETEGLDPTKHRIKLIGVKVNRPFTYHGKKYENFERIYRLEGETEKEKNTSELKIIDTFLRIIYSFKPDVITAHNGENFDWSFIIERCNQLGTSIDDMSKPYFNGKTIYKNPKETILKLGGEVETFHQTIVPGTIITDSLHAVRRAQATDSNFKEANLKYSAKYLEVVKPNRVYVPGDIIDKTLIDDTPTYAFNNTDGKWYKITDDKPLQEGYEIVTGKYIVERYLFDDLQECNDVELTLNQSAFSICKLLPLSFQKCCTMGTAGQWKSLMMAWSYENDLAIPFAENTGKFTGGLSRLLKVGFSGKQGLVKLDYNSLYPSIILTWAIEDEKDISGVTLKFLNYMLTSREAYKKEKKNSDINVSKYETKMNNGEKLTSEENSEYHKALADFAKYDKLQSVRKVFCNSYFGSLSSNNASVYPWKSLKCGERTTCTGRQALRLMIGHFSNISTFNGGNYSKDYNYEPIVGDTDGFNFELPLKFRYTEDNPYISPGLSRETKKGKKYIGFEADLAEFNDIFMKDFHYAPNACNKMGCGLDERISSSLNLSRKNYCDYFPEKPYPKDIKYVGNSIKSKKMSIFIEKFINDGVRLLVQNKGKEFLDAYYAYIEKIYNYQIPLKDIASKGKVKKSIPDYIADCNTLTKAGSKKSRQAWMELAIKNNLKVDLGETLYYINTGTKRTHSDVKRVTHYNIINENNEIKDIKNQLDKEWKKAEDGKNGEKKKLKFDEWVKKHYPQVKVEDEIILCAELLPREIVESEKDYFCEEGKEYNVEKYIEQFNKRITPLLVCFDKSIRDKILVTKPSDRQYFTEQEATLCSGQPTKEGDQDTYEALMTMEDKEIRFWMAHPEWEIPYLKECGMDWEKIKSDYIERTEKERQLGIDKIRQAFNEAVLNITPEEYDKIEDGKLPPAIDKIAVIDPLTFNFMSKDYPDVILGTIYDVMEGKDFRHDSQVTNIEFSTENE